MVQEHDQVVLTCPLPALGLEPGDVGVVVHVFVDAFVDAFAHAFEDAHAAAACFEVEFMSLDGRTIGVQKLDASQLRPVSASAVPHQRLRTAV